MLWIPLVGIILVLGVLLAGAASFLWEIGLQLGIAEGWPETTFVYEHESGGDRKVITRYRLTYYGRNDWFEKVLPSEPVVLPHGTFPQPQYMRRMDRACAKSVDIRKAFPVDRNNYYLSDGGRP